MFSTSDVIAGVSALISIGSLIVAVEALRRSEARLIVTLDLKRDLEDHTRVGPLTLTVHNKGRGEAQVTTVFIAANTWTSLLGSAYARTYEITRWDAETSTPIPCTLKGGHEIQWKIDANSNLYSDWESRQIRFLKPFIYTGSTKIYTGPTRSFKYIARGLDSQS